MCVESAQILCTAAILRGVSPDLVPYRPTHQHHPCVQWAAGSIDNLTWLWIHAQALCDEYTLRYGRRHRSELAVKAVDGTFTKGDPTKHTAFALAMPDLWKHPVAVTAYRNYYIAEKSYMAKWQPRAVTPSWWPFKDGTCERLPGRP